MLQALDVASAQQIANCHSAFENSAFLMPPGEVFWLHHFLESILTPKALLLPLPTSSRPLTGVSSHPPQLLFCSATIADSVLRPDQTTQMPTQMELKNASRGEYDQSQQETPALHSPLPPSRPPATAHTHAPRPHPSATARDLPSFATVLASSKGPHT